MRTKAFLKSRDERKRVEMRFAHLKSHHGFERMRLRGLSGARDEFLLAAIVQNLKTLALRIPGATTRPAARIVCLRSLRQAAVASASRPPQSKTSSRLTSAGSKSLKSHNANRETYFFNSIGQNRSFDDLRSMSGLLPESGPPICA